MKKPVFVAIVACMALLAAGPLVTGSSADDLDFMLRTTPESPRGWTPSTTALSGTSTAGVEYTGGPRVPDDQGDGDVTPHGGGSLTLRTGTNEFSVARSRNPFLDGAPVARVDIEYSWITEDRPATTDDPPGTDRSAPGLELTVTGENGRETLYYEPQFNRTTNDQFTPTEVWQRDDAGPRGPHPCYENETSDGTTTTATFEGCGPGLWYSSSSPPPSTTTGTSSGQLFTLETYGTTINPNATVATDVPGGAFAVSAGCSVRVVSSTTTTCAAEFDEFEGAVDDVLLERIGSPRTTFDFEPSIFEVRPANHQGWVFRPAPPAGDTTTSTTAAGTPASVTLVTGPTDPTDPDHATDPDPNDADDPFFGLGSVRLAVGDNGDNLAEARNSDFDGMNVGDIDALAYGTYVMNRFASGGCEEAPYLRLNAQVIVAAVPQSRTLYFHPCDQTGFQDPATAFGPVPLRTWQRWDAANEAVWRFREETAAGQTAVTHESVGAICVGADCRATLEQFSRYPGGATVADTTEGSLAIAAGGGSTTNPNSQAVRWVNFVGHADFLTHDTATTTGRTYDFESEEVEPEPQPPTTTSTTTAGATTTTTIAGTTTTTAPGQTTTTTAPGATTTTTTPSNTTTTRAPQGTSTQVTRIDGADRIATAIAISQRQNPNDTAGAVVLARSDTYPDALAAAPLAAHRAGPLLLTPPTNLDDRVAAEVHRVLPDGGTVHIAGGGNAIRTEVENELRNAGYNVVRHAGRNRFETATLLAEQIPAPGTAFLATGLKFADALPAGAAAAAVRGVVVLTANSDMPPETAAYLNARPNIQRVAVGGPASRADPAATSVVGADRFETAANLAQRYFTGAATAGVASGANFPDALGGGAHVGFRGGPLLLTRPETLSEPARQYLAANRNSLRNVFIYGGPNAVSSSTENQIRSATT